MNKLKNDYVQSTLDFEAKAFLKEIIPVNELIVGYQNQFSLSVQKYFNGITEIKIYECESTKYRFFYPYNIDGDGGFYECLQNFDWYYMPWKWEHEITKNLLSGHEKVLEVGSGGLGFVENLFKSGYNITGLELNEESIVKAKKNRLNVLNETIQRHSINNFDKYDLVCSYQVLEHISEVNSFIEAQINCLKKGGKLVISVPNNDSFIKYSKGGLLNFPPHHMGLWNKRSLTSLVNLFNLKVDKVIFEPLQEYHLDWYVTSVFQNRINKNKFVKFIFNRFSFKRIFRFLIKKTKNKIHGHTIMVIYTKI
ncbi:MAG: class I SAM-dependent methyltransferase [bacterium]|nr:class I SAM-dependent methyltransferase [bacterium]